MTNALVQPDGRIAQVENDDDIFPVASPLKWIAVPDDTTTLHTWDGSNVVEPVVIDSANSNKQHSRRQAHLAILDSLVDEPTYAALPEVAAHKAIRDG